MRFSFPILFVIAFSASLARASDSDRAGFDFFEKHIRPVLAEQCYKCHSAQAEKLKGKLLLDTREGLIRGGEGGPIVVPGDPDKSRLIIALRFTDEDMQMPPKHQLPREQVEAFEKWVKMGAPDPRTEPAAASAPAPAYNWEQAKKFWCFQPIANPPVPQVDDARWALSPIDQLLMNGYEARGLKPVGPADKRTLIRRATYDLSGLPPTPGEIDAFLSANSADAFAK